MLQFMIMFMMIRYGAIDCFKSSLLNNFARIPRKDDTYQRKDTQHTTYNQPYQANAVKVQDVPLTFSRLVDTGTYYSVY